MKRLFESKKKKDMNSTPTYSYLCFIILDLILIIIIIHKLIRCYHAYEVINTHQSRKNNDENLMKCRKYRHTLLKLKSNKLKKTLSRKILLYWQKANMGTKVEVN